MKTGLFGGTFSPPHIAHVRAARLFCNAVGLDRLYVMPAGIPPHKVADKWGSAECRLEMTRLAFSSFAEVSDYEIAKEGRSYTVDTLRYLKDMHPSDELYMLVGEDMLFSFDTWRSPGEIMSLCTVVAMRRKDTDPSLMEAAAEDYKMRYGARVILIDADPLEISSTAVRERLATGGDASDLLPSEVCEYINKNNLYRNEN